MLTRYKTIVKMNFNCSTISKAIVNNDVEVFKELLNKRKRIDIPDNLGYTSLHIAAKKSASIDPYILDALLNHPDVEINGKTVEGFTSLYIACNSEKPNIEVIRKIVAHGADPNICDTEDISPLHLACKFGNVQLVELLVKYKADINSKDFNSYTPLHYSIEYKQEHVAECLLKANADADIPDLHGLNPLMFAIVNKCSFAYLLVDYTRNLDSKTKDNQTALQLAIKAHDLNMAQLLIDKGADIYLAENTSAPLMQALKEYNFPVFKMIWAKLDPKRLKNYDEIFRKILITCNATSDYQYIQLITNDERLVCDIRDKKGILAFIFYKGTNLNSQYTEAYFETLKPVYESFFACLIRQGIRMSSADVESFIFYFYTCPYRIEILKRLLDNTKADITEHLVIYAFEYDLKMGALLLQHCLDVYPANLFDHFRHMSQLQVDIFNILEYELKYFTPSKAQRVQIVEKLKIMNNDPTNLDVYKLLSSKNNVKSLRELSRDVVRTQFQEVCETSSDFLERLEQLEIPTVIKDYIRLKLTVRSA